VLDAAAELLGHVIIYRDVTEEALASAAKEEFISVASHELRTPLSSIKTAVDLLARDGPADAARAAELVDIAQRNLARLIRLVDDLLDLSRLKSGRLSMERRPTAVNEVIGRALDTVRGFATSREVVIHTDVAGHEAVVVLANADRLEQVLVNLLANAIKFSPPGGDVRVIVRTAGTMARLEVADQGPGIPADQLEAIFDKFYQIESAATRAHGGAGLGLAISRGIVEHLGGRVWSEKSPERGARFVVELPLAREGDAPLT
jgi:signal transduction histidine kinase